MEKVDGSPPKTTFMSPEGNFYFSFTEVKINSGLLFENFFLNFTVDDRFPPAKMKKELTIRNTVPCRREFL
jgi:hypothetical protein